MRALSRADRRLLVGCVLLAAAAGFLHARPVGAVLPFAVSGLALAAFAALVGTAVDALGDRLGAGATGVVQAALGNLPELFVCVFALRAGLVDVVRAAIVGSILSNVLLVLGLAFIVGGLRHGPQTFAAPVARTTGLLLVLAVSVLMLPALTHALHAPAAGHELALSRVAAVVLLGVFVLSLPSALARTEGPPDPETDFSGTVRGWPLWLALGLLAAAALGAALVSDWFVGELTPALGPLHLSRSFAGLVVVAIASNAVENVVGIQLAARNRPDYAISIILQSPLQIALVLAPVLVLIAPLIGASFTLVLSPLLITVLALSVLVTVVVVFDGESTWLEGASLVGLYVVCAAAFFWGVSEMQLATGGFVFDAIAAGPADGRLVLLLHGFPQTSWCWRAVLPALAAAGYRVVAPDQRGYSPGARPDGVGAYRLPALVDDVVGMCDALGADRVDVVGHDWGAAVAWQLAGRHPDRVRTLTALSVPHPLAFVAALRSDPDQRRRSQYMKDFGAVGLAEQQLLGDGAGGLAEVFGGVPAVDGERYLALMRTPGVLTCCLNWYRAQALTDVTELGPILAPTLYVWSDQDAALGPVAAAATGGFVSGAYRFEVLAGVSHWIPEEAPGPLTGLLLEHLAAH